jgi:hypothetical protein
VPLIDLAIRAAKPAEKNYRLYDSPGLYLEVAPAGGKWWRFKYFFEGKEKSLSLGGPDMASGHWRARFSTRRLTCVLI